MHQLFALYEHFPVIEQCSQDNIARERAVIRGLRSDRVSGQSPKREGPAPSHGETDDGEGRRGRPPVLPARRGDQTRDATEQRSPAQELPDLGGDRFEMSDQDPVPKKKNLSAKGTFVGSVSGTYISVNVMPFLPSKGFDYPPELRYSVLYLLSTDSFAWFEYWSGFLYGRRAGRFTRSDAVLDLKGQDSLGCDTPHLNYSLRSFHKQITLVQSDGKRVVRCDNQHELLFIGNGIYIPFDGLGSRLFPQRWEELQSWVDEFLKRGNDRPASTD